MIEQNKNSETPIEFTELEHNVIKLIAEGESVREIAKILNRSETTINTQRRNILQKGNWSNSKDLINYAIKNKLVEL